MTDEKAPEKQSQPDFIGFIHRVLFVLGLVIVTWVLYASRQVVLMGLTSVILAVIFGGVATVISRLLPWQHRKWGYRLALAIVLLSSAAMLAGLGWSLGPRVLRDLGTLQRDLPNAVESLQEYPLFKDLLSFKGDDGGALSRLITMLSSTALTMASGILGTLTAAFLILFTAVFLAADPSLYRGAVVSLFPVGMRPRAAQVLEACARGLWRWLLGQAFAMFLIGVLTTAGLYLIRMEYALTLGLMAGLLQFIPYIGPYLSAVPAVLVAVTVSPQMVLWVVVLYFCIQVVEGNFITPFVLQNKANLPPAFTLFSTVVFGVVFGPLGVIIATPVAVLLLVLFQELYQKDVLGLDVRSAGAPDLVRDRPKKLRTKKPKGAADPLPGQAAPRGGPGGEEPAV